MPPARFLCSRRSLRRFCKRCVRSSVSSELPRASKISALRAGWHVHRPLHGMQHKLGKAVGETNRAFSAPQHTQRAIRRIYPPREGSDIARRTCRACEGAFQPALGGDDIEALCERQVGTREHSPSRGLEADEKCLKLSAAQRFQAFFSRANGQRINADRRFRP